MKIKVNNAKSPYFGIHISPEMKYTIIKETKKFYNRKQAKNMINLIQNGSDNYKLDMFEMTMPNLREKSVFCNIFITSKAKSGKSCLIHAYLGKLKDKKIKYNLLKNIIKNI